MKVKKKGKNGVWCRKPRDSGRNNIIKKIGRKGKMNNKLVLTSLLAIVVATPAMAVSFREPMEINTTYTKAATATNMGVSSGEATAAAYYTILPGYYLPANTYVATTCSGGGNFCPGTTLSVTKSTSAQGLESCSTATSGAYTNADAGADSKFDCYNTSCPTTNQHLAAGGSLTGKVYYGNLNNCAPSACADGYTMLDINATSKFGTKSSNSWGGMTSATQFVNQSGTTVDSGSYGLISGDTWAVDFGGDGKLYGASACKAGIYSDAKPLTVTEANALTSGSTCYCWLTGYKPSTGLQTRRSMSSLAVPFTKAVDNCETNCARECAQGVASGTVSSDIALLLEHASNDQKCINSAYTVTYSCGTGNDISGSPSRTTQTVEYVTAYTTANKGTCAKTGYTFANSWRVSGTSTDLAANSSVQGGYIYTADKTYTANWTENHYNIAYNANGGSGTTAGNSNVAYTDNQTLTSNGFTNGIKKFLGWSTSSTATTATYTNGQSVSGLSATDGATVTLYAVWGNCDECNVDPYSVECKKSAPNGVCTYTTSCKDGYGNITGNGTATASCSGNTITLNWTSSKGTAPTATSCTYGQAFDMPEAITGVTGYAFNKWNVNSNTFNAGARGVICNYDNLGVYNNAATISASWTANTISIVWDGIANENVTTADGSAMTNFNSTTNTAKSSVSYDGDIYTPTEGMERTGMEFVGWKFVKSND